MSVHFFNFLTPESGQLTREAVEREIERLITLLDVLDPDPDLEPNGDEEPWLGWCDGREPRYGGTDDRELDTCDDEPTLGANEMRFGESQVQWSRMAYGLDEIEEENEHGGDINDVPHDDDELDDDRDGLAGVADVLAMVSDSKGGEWDGREYRHYLRFEGKGQRIAQNQIWDARLRHTSSQFPKTPTSNWRVRS